MSLDHDNKPRAQARVLMYVTRSCPYCWQARRLLAGKNVVIEEIDVTGKPELWQSMEALTGRDTVPQIFIGEVHVGGYDDMATLDWQGKLDALLFVA